MFLKFFMYFKYSLPSGREKKNNVTINFTFTEPQPSKTKMHFPIQGDISDLYQK